MIGKKFPRNSCFNQDSQIQSDGGVFRNSSLYRELMNHTLDMPAPKPFPEGSASIDDIDPTLANLTTRPFLASRENNSSSQESKIIRDKFKNFINS
ncbi:unnamed protein product [Gordionus sp. m RMFG-2023]